MGKLVQKQEKKDDTVIMKKKTVIEMLQTLEGLKRKLHRILK